MDFQRSPTPDGAREWGRGQYLRYLMEAFKRMDAQIQALNAVAGIGNVPEYQAARQKFNEINQRVTNAGG